MWVQIVQDGTQMDCRDRAEWETIFDSLNPVRGKVTGPAAKKEMDKSLLPNNVLEEIWNMADVDKNGDLTRDEFARAMHLININKHILLDDSNMPKDVPRHLITPSNKQGKIYELISM